MGVPKSIVLPFMGVSFDSSRAFVGSSTMPVKTLLFGQKLASGTGEVNTQILVFNADEVAKLAGYGSMVHRQAIKYFANNSITETYIMLLEDADTATKATTLVTIAGTATANGELDLYINGASGRYAVGVTTADAAVDVADNMIAVINADASAPVVATAAAGVITLTAKNAGIAAGDVDVRLNYNAGEEIPAGLTVSVAATTDGTVDPTVQDILDNLGDTWFNIFSSGYNDATNLTLIQDYLLEVAGPMIMTDGGYYTAMRGTVSELITFSTSGTRNCQYVILNDAEKVPASVAEIAAAVAARTAESIMEDTAVPLHRMTITGISPVAPTDRRTVLERNTLASNGIATLTHSLGVQTEATVTMYLLNSAGAADIAYQQQNTIYQLMYARYTFVQRILSRYPRAKLADSIDNIQSGQQVMTEAIGKAEAVAWFINLEAEGILENLEQFKEDLVCLRSKTNPNRIEWLLPPDLINQFIVGSADMQFILES